MDFKKLAMDELGNVLNGQTAGSKPTRKTKVSQNTNAAGVIKAAGDVLGSTNKVAGAQKAATDILDKNGDGNVVDDLLGDVTSMFKRKK